MNQLIVHLYRHGLQSLPPSPKRAERKGRRRPFREAGSGHKQWNTVSCVDTFSIISKFSARIITLILPLCCLFNPERHELARGIYIIREVYIAMFVIRIIQLTIAFNHSYHTCNFDIDWISILFQISKINANFDIIAACSSSPSLLLLPFASCS